MLNRFLNHAALAVPTAIGLLAATALLAGCNDEEPLPSSEPAADGAPADPKATTTSAAPSDAAGTTAADGAVGAWSGDGSTGTGIPGQGADGSNGAGGAGPSSAGTGGDAAPAVNDSGSNADTGLTPTGPDAGGGTANDGGPTAPGNDSGLSSGTEGGRSDSGLNPGTDGGSGDAGVVVPPADAGPDSSPPGSTGDLCTSKPCQLQPPDLTNAVDLKTFRVPNEPACNPLVPRVTQRPGHITTPPSLYETRLPACRFPVSMPGPAVFTPTIDGDLADWSAIAPASIDREGDLVAPDADYDLLRVYQAEDRLFYYFAFAFKNAWPTGNGATLQLDFAHVVFPTDNTQNVDAAPMLKLFVGQNELYDVSTLQPILKDHAVKGLGRTLELRIARTAIDLDSPSAPSALGTGPWTLTPYVVGSSTGSTGAGTIDMAGAVWGGLPPDYGCLVPTANDRVKLFVFRHAPDVDAGEAEVVNRSVIAAAPCIEKVTNDTYDLVDTIGVTTVRTMAAAGLHSTLNGIFVAAEQVDNPLTESGFASRLHVAAHEYAHGLNSGDYALPTSWLKEGHSEMFANRAVEILLGTATAQYSRLLAAELFLDGEDASTPVSLTGEPWPLPNSTMTFDYAKAELFTEQLPTVITDDALRHVYRRLKSGGAAYTEGDAFLTHLRSQPEFRGAVSNTMWSGWFDGAYDTSLFPRTRVQEDTDHDGLLDYQETIWGLLVANPDTDGDRVTDAFELAAGTGPKIRDPLSALVMDNSLADWDQLAPSLLAVIPTTKGTTSACSGAPSIVRGGVVFDGEWLAAGIEFDRPSTDPTFRVMVAFIDDSSSRARVWEVLADARTPYLYAFDDSSTALRPIVTTAPVSGTQAELFYRADWLGWNGGLPSGVNVRIATFVGDGSSIQCEISSNALTVARAVP